MEYQQNSRKDWGYEKMNKKYCRAAGAKKKKSPNIRTRPPHVKKSDVRYADDACVELAYQFICFVYHSQNWLKFVYDRFTMVICLNGWFIWCLQGSFLRIFYLPLFHILVL